MLKKIITFVLSLFFIAACNGTRITSTPADEGAGGNGNNTNANKVPTNTLVSVVTDESGAVVASLLGMLVNNFGGTGGFVYNKDGQLLIVNLKDGTIVKEGVYFTSDDCTGDKGYVAETANVMLDRVVRGGNSYYKITGYVTIDQVTIIIGSFLSFNGTCAPIGWVPPFTLDMAEVDIMATPPSDLHLYAPLKFTLQTQ